MDIKIIEEAGPDSRERGHAVKVWKALQAKHSEGEAWPDIVPHTPRLNLPPLDNDISIRVGLECTVPTKDDKHRVAHLGMRVLLQELYDHTPADEVVDDMLVACAATAYGNLREEFLRQLPEALKV